MGRENAALNPGWHRCASSAPTISRRSANSPDCRWRRRGRALPDYPRLEQRQFDLVLLDPGLARSAFGTVDLLRDYQSLLKPALLTTAEGGVLICCNNGEGADGRMADAGAALRRQGGPAGT